MSNVINISDRLKKKKQPEPVEIKNLDIFVGDPHMMRNPVFNENIGHWMEKEMSDQIDELISSGAKIVFKKGDGFDV